MVPFFVQIKCQLGKSYEVAEIYEWPWHLMVRNPGERRWPAPDNPWFGWSADEFETPAEPVPILRCGFIHVGVSHQRMSIG